MLDVEGLCHSFGGVTVLDGLTFTVERGEVVALVGVNGSGKTTALRCIVGTQAPDRGVVRLNGRRFDERDPRTRAVVCALLDDFAWFPDMTVREHLELFAFAHDQGGDVVGAALREVGIEHVEDRLPGTLSSGQTRRFGLAQALVRPWDLLVLDEPEQRLDVTAREWLGDFLRAQADAGRAVLMASHDPVLRARSGARDVELGAAT